MAWQLYNICCCSQTQGCSVSYVTTPVVSNQSTTATWSMANWSTFLDHQSHFRSIVSSTSHVRPRGPKRFPAVAAKTSLWLSALAACSVFLITRLFSFCWSLHPVKSTNLREPFNAIYAKKIGFSPDRLNLSTLRGYGAFVLCSSKFVDTKIKKMHFFCNLG